MTRSAAGATVGIGMLAVATSAFFAPAAHAVCAGQYPTIGTVAATTTQGTMTQILLNDADVFDTSSFPTNATSIDDYNTLARAYKQNNFRVPSSYAYQFTSTDNQDAIRKNLQIDVPTAALKDITYHVGDIIIMGPPHGGSCSQYGFTGFFGQDGVIQAVIADDSAYFPYTYGSDTLSLYPGIPHDCSTDTNGYRTCSVPISYSIDNNTGASIDQGSTNTQTGTRTFTIALMQSTETTFPTGMTPEDFYPDTLEHVITFAASQVTNAQSQIQSLLAQVTQLEALLAKLQGGKSEIGGASSCPTITSDLYVGETDSGTNGEVSMLQQFLGISPTTGYFGPVTEKAVQQWQASHGIVSAGSPSTTGYGAVGPRTRAAITASCTGAATSSSVTGGGSAFSEPSGGLVIDSVSQGVVGQSVTIQGSGFSSSNSIHFGQGYVGPVASSDNGTTITFTLPNSISVCDPFASSTTPCVDIASIVQSGNYQITVNNGSEVSNSLPFVVDALGFGTDTSLGFSPTQATPFGTLSVTPCASMSSSTLCSFIAKWFSQNSDTNGTTHITVQVYTASTYQNASNSINGLSALLTGSQLSSPDYSFESPDANSSHVFALPAGSYEFLLVGYDSSGKAQVLQRASATGPEVSTVATPQ